MSRPITAPQVMWRIACPAFLVVLLVFVIQTRSTSETSKDALSIDIIASLMDRDESTRNRAVFEWLDRYKAVINAMIPLVDPANASKYSYDTEAAAAFLLGELRATDAVPVLAKALAEIPTPGVTDDLSPYDDPFCRALVKIGRPSVPAMIDIIERSDDQRLQRQSVMVLVQVLGGPRHTLELLEKLKARSTDEQKTRRIEVTMTWAEEYFKKGEAKEPLY